MQKLLGPCMPLMVTLLVMSQGASGSVCHKAIRLVRGLICKGKAEQGTRRVAADFGNSSWLVEQLGGMPHGHRLGVTQQGAKDNWTAQQQWLFLSSRHKRDPVRTPQHRGSGPSAGISCLLQCCSHLLLPLRRPVLLLLPLGPHLLLAEQPVQLALLLLPLVLLLLLLLLLVLLLLLQWPCTPPCAASSGPAGRTSHSSGPSDIQHRYSCVRTPAAAQQGRSGCCSWGCCSRGALPRQSGQLLQPEPGSASVPWLLRRCRC